MEERLSKWRIYRGRYPSSASNAQYFLQGLIEDNEPIFEKDEFTVIGIATAEDKKGGELIKIVSSHIGNQNKLLEKIKTAEIPFELSYQAKREFTCFVILSKDILPQIARNGEVIVLEDGSKELVTEVKRHFIRTISRETYGSGKKAITKRKRLFKDYDKDSGQWGCSAGVSLPEDPDFNELNIKLEVKDL